MTDWTVPENQECIGKYLSSVYYGEGYVSLDKLINIDMKYDPDLRKCKPDMYGEVSAERIIAQALQDGFKIQMRYDEWCLVLGRDQ